MIVYVVVCLDPEDRSNVVHHIFSTPEKAEAYADSDQRPHVLYDYMVDVPERMESPMQ